MGNWPWALFWGGAKFAPPILGPWAGPRCPITTYVINPPTHFRPHSFLPISPTSPLVTPVIPVTPGYIIPTVFTSTRANYCRAYIYISLFSSGINLTVFYGLTPYADLYILLFSWGWAMCCPKHVETEHKWNIYLLTASGLCSSFNNLRNIWKQVEFV